MKKTCALLLSLFALTAFSATEPKAAYSLVQAGKAVMIDVREKDELKAGMIENALWFPLSKISTSKEWKKDFDQLTEGKKIFLYCRSGRRSGQVETLLRAEGTESENLGGFETLKNILPVKVSK